jgi:hypothetical protein
MPTRLKYLGLSLHSPKPDGLWLDACQASFIPSGAPASLQIDDARGIAPEADWRAQVLACSEHGAARWGDYDAVLLTRSYENVVLVKVETSDFDIPRTFALLKQLDFELAAASANSDWYTIDEVSYRGPGFGDGHYALGWCCAFKGAGHDRLVSRRWLEHGPWRLLRDEATDLSLVQFCDLEADLAVMRAQGTSAHRRMGISADGGFIQTDFCWCYDWEGTYVPEERTLQVVVVGRDLAPFEMLEARALVQYQHLGPDQPLDHVAFVFPEEERARQHLHELWLRGLQCWAIIRGDLLRLDHDYQPAPTPKPPWVAEVEAREAAAARAR